MLTDDEMITELAKRQLKFTYNCKEFVPGKSPVLYSGPFWNEKETEAVLRSFLTGRWVTAGENVAKFQARFEEMFNVRHAHMVNSGSSANLCLIAAMKKYYKWKNGAEIIVSPCGFPTTIAPIVQNNLKPVFVDIEWDTLNFDVTQIESKINKNTVAIFVSPVLGNPPDLHYLRLLANRHSLQLIGDNCDSLGSRFKGRLITEFYDAWSTSFYPAHHISTGEGGMVCSDIKEIVDHARSFSWWGRDCHCVGSGNLLACGTCGQRFSEWLGVDQGILDHKYIFTNMGYNLKPLDLQGAIGIEQLKKIPEIDCLRRENYNRWKRSFERWVSEGRVIDALPDSDPSWFGVPIVMVDFRDKVAFVKHLEDNLIQTRNYFAGNILLHPGYDHLDDAKKYPNASKTLRNTFFVGCPPHYNDEVFKYIDSVLEKWFLRK